MTTLTQAAVNEAVKMASTEPAYWFVKLEADVTQAATTVARLVNQPGGSIEYPTGSGDIWYPFSFSAPRERTEAGSIPTVELKVMDVKGELLGYVDRAGGFMGKRVTAFCTSAANLSSTDDAWQAFEGHIVGAGATTSGAVFTIGFVGLQAYVFPKRTAQRDRCDFVLGGPGCFFQFPTFGQTGFGDPNIMLCSRTLDGDGGCVAHGNNERARNISVIHPQQFGGMPSIPLGPRR